MRPTIFVLATVLAGWPLAADALTVRDVVQLTRAGLSEETLLALIEVDPSVFPIDAESLQMLKAEGVAERVIVAMIRSGRVSSTVPSQAPPEPSLEAAAPAPAPSVVVIEHREPPTIVREVTAVPYPVYIPVVRRHRDADVEDGPGRDGSKPQPVYWGWGGKLRPDAWQPK